MSKGYALFQYNVSDGEKLTQYIPKAVSTVIANGGTILVETDDRISGKAPRGRSGPSSWNSHPGKRP